MVTIEREIESAILGLKRWADLDNRMRDLIGSSHEYDKKILKHSIEKQLRYRGNLVRFVINNEYDYYIRLLKYSQDHFMLFPYHLSDFLTHGMRKTPFQYYLETMAQIIEQEKSYDTLPNFTAADCLLLLGIGRNQYIDIMNEWRSTNRRGILDTILGLRRSAISLLPSKPDKNVPIEPWWFVNIGYILDEDVPTMVTPAEKSIIDQLLSLDGLWNQTLACNLDEQHVRSLYLKGLIYLDVPIYDDDYIVVPPLEGFVMNRVTGDYLETLLYKIFVSIDSSTTVRELATILDVDIQLVKNAVSMYCRLKFAYKKNIYIDIDKCHPSWREKLENYKKMGINVSQQVSKFASKDISEFMNELSTVDDCDEGTEVFDATPSITESSYNLQEKVMSNQLHHHHQQQQQAGPKKIVFFYDSNLAAFLMMGNLSSQLKNHAVTMFEVGKLSDEWIDGLLAELSKIKGDAIEEDGYEAKRYYIHALMLHRTIEFIRTSLPTMATNDANNRIGLDLIRIESLSNLDNLTCERFLEKNYQMIISVAPLNQDVKLSATTSLPHLGPGSPLINSLWFRMYLYHCTGYGPPSLMLVQGYRLTSLPDVFESYDVLMINHWNREPTCVTTRTALNAINEALTHSPVLVQAYPIQPTGGNLISSEEKVFIPLPLTIAASDDQSAEPNIESSPVNCPFVELESAPAIVSLRKCLDLTRSCGYVTLLRSPESAKKLVREHESSNIYGSRRKSESPLDTLTGIGAAKSDDNDEQQEQQDADVKTSTDRDRLELNDLTLFDCHFGIPLFDRFLNKQVRNRISSMNLCDASSLQELVRSTRELNDKLSEFVDKFSSNTLLENLDATNFGDQRHFFSFPSTEQFKCSVPRPAENLLFANGTLAVYNDPSDQPPAILN